MFFGVSSRRAGTMAAERLVVTRTTEGAKGWTPSRASPGRDVSGGRERRARRRTLPTARVTVPNRRRAPRARAHGAVRLTRRQRTAGRTCGRPRRLEGTRTSGRSPRVDVSRSRPGTGGTSSGFRAPTDAWDRRSGEQGKTARRRAPGGLVFQSIRVPRSAGRRDGRSAGGRPAASRYSSE